MGAPGQPRLGRMRPMKISRRDALKVAAAVPALGAAKAPAPLPPIVTSGSVRLYPTWDSTTWWTSEPLSGWNLPHAVSLGASFAPDGAISRLDDPQLANSWMEFSAPLTFY